MMKKFLKIKVILIPILISFFALGSVQAASLVILSNISPASIASGTLGTSLPITVAFGLENDSTENSFTAYLTVIEQGDIFPIPSTCRRTTISAPSFSSSQHSMSTQIPSPPGAGQSSQYTVRIELVPGNDGNMASCPIASIILRDEMTYGVSWDSDEPPTATDSDGDGVDDTEDDCPNQGSIGYGVDTNGCPIPPPQPEIINFTVNPTSVAEGSVWEPLLVTVGVSVNNPGNENLTLYVGFSEGGRDESNPITSTCRSVNVSSSLSVGVDTVLPAVMAAQSHSYNVWAVLARNAPTGSCPIASSVDRAIQVYGVEWVIRDADDDALLDVWERNGLDYDLDGDIDIDLPSLGARIDYKDIFVYVDWLETQSHSHEPDFNSLNEVTTPFAAHEITLHIIQGNSIPEGNYTVMMPSDTWSEFDVIKDSAEGLPEGYELFAHYVIFGHHITTPGSRLVLGRSRNSISSSETFAAGASDFLVAHGSISDYFSGILGNLNTGYLAPSSNRVLATTFMHELGHNLGLGHGGNDTQGAVHINSKPNYLSIMNYFFSAGGLLSRAGGTDNLVLDYSEYTGNVLPLLNEGALDERNHISTSALQFVTFRYCGSTARSETLNNPVDWNCDNDTQDPNVQQDVNNDSGFSTLTSSNDWEHLVFSGGSIGADSNIELPLEYPEDYDEPTTDDLPILGPYVFDEIGIHIVQNAINLTSRGKIPMIIYGTEDFDVTRLDLRTVRVSGAPIGIRGNGEYMAQLSDRNKDGIDDLFVHIDNADSQLAPYDNTLCLVGLAYDRVVGIRGEDTVRIVPPNSQLADYSFNCSVFSILTIAAEDSEDEQIEPEETAEIVVNIAPVQINLQERMNKNSRTPLIIDITTLLSTDGVDLLSEILEMSPSHGQVTLNEDGRSIGYMPRRGYSGFDYFRISLNGIHVIVEVDIR